MFRRPGMNIAATSMPKSGNQSAVPIGTLTGKPRRTNPETNTNLRQHEGVSMGRRGRPSKSGARTKSGQLSRVGHCLVRDYGNIKVMERHNRFRHFIDDKGLV